MPTDPPSVLVASERGDLVALAPDTPDVVRWRFHPGGSMYGPPGFDPETGRLYAGATDKKVYALDGRGFFLWAAQVDDNVATRPVVTRGIVSFASEGGTAFGVDATTGKQKWKRSLDASSVASPAVVDDTIVFGSDGGTIRAFDIDDGGGRWSSIRRKARSKERSPLTPTASCTSPTTEAASPRSRPTRARRSGR